MIGMRSRLIGLAMVAAASVAVAQSPGSVESELIYAREYMDSGKWDYAMWRYEAILRSDPDNAEAQAGYAKAKANYEAKKAKQEAQAKALSTPARGRVHGNRTVRKGGGGQSKAQGKKAMCDAQYGTCHAIYKSVATCAPRRAMCYTQNGVK